MGIITNSNLLTTEEEFIWLEYIESIARKTFNLFKPKIIKNNTQVKLAVKGVEFNNTTMGHYADQQINIITHNILTTGLKYGLERLKTVVNTITVNAVIHELFHADQYMNYREIINEKSVIEDSVYSITLNFIKQHHNLICEHIGYIDIGDLQLQYQARNLALYGNIVPPYDFNHYERLSPQIMIDNILKYITSKETYSKYVSLNPSTKPCIGVNLNGSEYLKDIVWVKFNNQYEMVNIKYIQRECDKYFKVGSEIKFTETLFCNEDSIIFIFKLRDQKISPIYFREDNK